MCKLVQDLWIPIPIGTRDFAMVLFMDSLSSVKQNTITWAHTKRLRDEHDLRHCELFLDQILNRPGLGFLDQDTKDEVFSCEDRCKNILGEKEVAWRLKIWALLLTCGDENTKKKSGFCKRQEIIQYHLGTQ